MNNLLVFGGIAVAIVISLFFEDSRDYIFETFAYIFSFEWWGDFWELAGSAFEDIGEISFIGLLFGIIGIGIIFLLRDYMLSPFLLHMGSFEAIFWGGATYLGSFLGGYFVGKGMENS